VVEQTLKGQQSQESTDGRPHPGQGHEVVAERTPGGSKASKRACRPLTGEPSVGGKGTERAVHSHECAEATGLAIEGIRRPGSCVHGGFTFLVGFTGQRVVATGEIDREAPAGTAPAAVEREPARKNEARESGYGSSGRESSVGKLQ
jgi:hypothetical protein